MNVIKKDNSRVKKQTIRFTVNGKKTKIETYPMMRLIDVLREELLLTGTKEGCSEGECGACSVLIDGVLSNSCLIPIIQMEGKKIVTIEGIANETQAKKLMQNFLKNGGAQCGFCTPGMILATKNLLDKISTPTLKEVREALSGNLCRCTGYMKIFSSIIKKN